MVTAVLLLGLLAVLWGVNWPIMKIGLAEVPPWVFRASASAVAAPCMFAIALLAGHSIRVPRRDLPGLILAGILNLAFFNILVLYGIDRMDAGRAGILAYTMPLWASLLSALVAREMLPTRSIIGLAIGLAGMGLLFWEDIAVLSGPPTGPLLVVAAAISWGAGTVVIKHARLSIPITVAVGWQHVIGGIPVGLIALTWDVQNLGEVTFWPGFAVVYNMTITGVICYWAYFKVVSLLPVVASTVGTLMVPVIGVFSNALIYQVSPHPLDYGALVAVMIAVFLVMVRPSRKEGR